MCSKLSLRGNAIGLLVAVIAAILFPYWVGDSLLGYTNSLWPIVMLVGVIVLWRYVSRLTPSRREEKNAWIFASLLSLMTSFGYHLNNDFIPFDSIGLWLALVCFTVVIKQLLIAFWHWLSLTEIVLDRQPKGLRWLNPLLDRPLLVWCFIVLCWVPAYLSIFPGGFIYDAAKELNQTFTGYIGDLPYLHSAIITTLLPWSKSVTGEYTLGIAIYVVAQMVVMGAMFAQIVTKFYRRGFNAWVVLGMTVYYALFPVIAMTVTQTVRDVLFAALLNYSFFLLYLLAVEKNTYFPLGISR